jgi:hypothetical protein
MKILSLYSGTKSVEKAMLKLWPDAEVVSVDLSPVYRPTICTDIRTWNFYEVLEHGSVDVVWASPPCTHYSRANQGKRDLDLADECVQAAWRIIEYLQPACFFLENPFSGLLARRDFMTQYAPYKKHCTYCHYGTEYRKATNIWTNVNVRLLSCSKETPCANFRRFQYHPDTAQKGPSKLPGGRWATGHPTATLWQVPERLVHTLCLASGLPIAPENIPSGVINGSSRPDPQVF